MGARIDSGQRRNAGRRIALWINRKPFRRLGCRSTAVLSKGSRSLALPPQGIDLSSVPLGNPCEPLAISLEGRQPRHVLGVQL